MTVKETIHHWIDLIPNDAPGLMELYEEARLDLAIAKAREDVAAGRTIPVEEVIAQFEERCRLRRSSGS